MQANDGGWTPPKGHLDRNESAVDAAKRETFEEVGLREETGYRMHQADAIYSCCYYDKKRGRNKISTYFLAEYVPGADIILQARELKDFAWLSSQKAIETMGYDAMTKLIECGDKKICMDQPLPVLQSPPPLLTGIAPTAVPMTSKGEKYRDVSLIRHGELDGHL